MSNYKITLNKYFENIIGFSITANNFRRHYIIEIMKEKKYETVEQFINRKTKDFLAEIKEYRSVDRLIDV
jgi:hypothetical protein